MTEQEAELKAESVYQENPSVSCVNTLKSETGFKVFLGLRTNYFGKQ